MSETTAIAGILEILPSYDTPVHFVRVSTARGVELIAQGKSQGLPITASVNWHHLLLSNEQIAEGLPPFTSPYSPNLRFCPPLGEMSDRQALVEGVRSGVIDAIAVDHVAWSYEEKTQSFAETFPGAISYELILPCLWQSLITPGLLSSDILWRSLSMRPRSCWGLEASPDQDWLLFDPTETWLVNGQSLKTSAQNTPWWGHTVTGRVRATGRDLPLK